MKLMEEAIKLEKFIEAEIAKTTNPEHRARLRTQLSIIQAEKQILLLDERLNKVEEMLGIGDEKAKTIVN